MYKKIYFLATAFLYLLIVPAHAAPIKIIAVGDSLTAGYGVPSDFSFPAQLEKRLKADGLDVTVVNAGISGDTTAGGLARLPGIITQQPDIVILELGANDALRNMDPRQTRTNLDAMLKLLREAGIYTLLAGMQATPNMPIGSRGDFNDIYPDLAKKYDVPFYPFFLEGVARKTELNLADGLHPNGAGIGVIVEGVFPSLKAMILQLKK